MLRVTSVFHRPVGEQKTSRRPVRGARPIWSPGNTRASQATTKVARDVSNAFQTGPTTTTKVTTWVGLVCRGWSYRPAGAGDGDSVSGGGIGRSSSRSGGQALGRRSAGTAITRMAAQGCPVLPIERRRCHSVRDRKERSCQRRYGPLPCSRSKA